MAFRHEPGTHAVRCVGLLRYQHDCAGRIAWHESSDDSFATESADRPVAVFRCLRGDLRLLHACGGGVPPACVRRRIPAQHVATQGWLHCLGGDLRAEFHHSVQHILLHGLPHLVDCVGGGNDRSLHRARHSHQ